MEEKRLTPIKAIRKYCLDCSGDSVNEVKICPCKDCFLYPYRLGKNPYIKKNLTEEQRKQMGERLNKARNV